MNDQSQQNHDSEFDYIIVGSGAGGAPLAARLARAGKKVLVMEAGSSHTQRGPLDPGNEISRVPLLHGASTEHPDLAWRFFVDHYGSNGDQLVDGIPLDPKRHAPDAAVGENESHRGIFYPRAAAVGGCTVHNAMITIVSPDSDWDDLASFLGDPSWSGSHMRSYFQKLEYNEYLPAPDRSRPTIRRQLWQNVKNGVRFLLGKKLDVTSGKHGFAGWLHTSLSDITVGLRDKQLIKMVKAALIQAKREGLENAGAFVNTFLRGRFRQSLDPNHVDTLSGSPEGVVLIPLAIYGNRTTIHQDGSNPYSVVGRRSSPREFLFQTLAQVPNNLTIWTDCLVTKILFDDSPAGPGGNPRAIGVEYQRGERLYKAHVRPNDEAVEPTSVFVKKDIGEVILCGGAFNTPQLLMLSGIGDRQELETANQGVKKKNQIQFRVHLPGVGKNLQDRYEVAVVSEMNSDFSILDGATYTVPASPDEPPDRHLRRWREEGTGLYTTNGSVLGMFKRSRPELTKPDLFIFGIPGSFKGYAVGYSKIDNNNLFTWVILKSQSQNRDGTVRLRSTDPRDTPKINFNYFNTVSKPGKSASDPDVAALLHGVDFVRNICRRARSVVKAEVHPGEHVSTESATNDWIRSTAWGHHACGTCRMGPEGDDGAALDSRFRVRHVDGLRVVDASIFPTIPGYFIVSNIYMASEKAAEVILEDSRNRDRPEPSSPEYPRELQQREATALANRRRQLEVRNEAQVVRMQAFAEIEDKQQQDHSQSGNPTEQVAVAPARNQAESDLHEESESQHIRSVQNADGNWREDVTGLALSGGGIRSATFSLGILQNLARHHLLRKIDFLSTVSGGGYIGSCLGRFYDRLRSDPLTGQAPLSATPPADHVENELVKIDSPMIDWLRSHGNYIAPQGKGDAQLNLAIFVRNLLSVHLVVGVAVFTLFGLTNLIRYGLLDQSSAVLGLADGRADLPLGQMLQNFIGPWFSPWFILFEFLLLFLVVPRIIGYWIVSPDKHESFNPIPLLILFVVSGALLFYGVWDGLKLWAVLIGIGLLSSLIQVELAWRRGKKRAKAVGTGGPATQRAQTQNYLTYDLGLAIALAGGALAFAVIDSLAHGLQEAQLRGNITYVRALATLGGAIIALTPVARWLATFFREDENQTPSFLSRLLRRDVVAGAVAIMLLVLPLLFYCFAAHAAYQGGNAVWTGILATLAAGVLTGFFAWPTAVSFVNRSSLAQVYSARLARAYLGASNPARHRPEGINVTEVIPGDDVASIRDYQPHQASGPFHLINVTINQTLDFGSRLRKRDRQGLNMAVSCLGVTVGEKWHSIWKDASEAVGNLGSRNSVGLEPIGPTEGISHPLIDALDRDADRAEMLSLRQWVAISGAAVGPGRGRGTKLGTSLMSGLVNLRTGHWWDSGISTAARGGFPDLSFVRRILYLIPRIFATQCLLIFEWLARFPGPWERFWHLSDGGFFENLGCYELIRRRVPRIIVCDGGADPKYQCSDFAELIRKVRIDFGAQIEPFSEEDYERFGIPEDVRKHVGTLASLKPQPDLATNSVALSQKHAALFWVHYPGASAPRRSVLLYLKATITGDESEDVVHYHSQHPEFPHEQTADQFFDEAQWESYRKLGEHASEKIFGEYTSRKMSRDHWFWKIPLAESVQGTL